jgi:hypothetical protein
MRGLGRIRVAVLLLSLPVAGLVGTGCGGGSDFQDKPRPPVPVQLNGVITSSKVSVSPSSIGAGPVVILVSNQTNRSHTLTLDGPNIAPVRVGPINPLDTGEIQQTLQPGSYTVKAGSEEAVAKEIAPAHLTIGKPRPDSNDQVGLP